MTRAVEKLDEMQVHGIDVLYSDVARFDMEDVALVKHGPPDAATVQDVQATVIHINTVSRVYPQDPWWMHRSASEKSIDDDDRDGDVAKQSEAV